MCIRDRRRPRPEENPSPRQYEDEAPAPYVDYQPIDESDSDPDTWEKPSGDNEPPRRDRPDTEATSRFDY